MPNLTIDNILTHNRIRNIYNPETAHTVRNPDAQKHFWLPYFNVMEKKNGTSISSYPML